MTLECADCGGLIDQYGESLEPDNGCVWLHDSDCETCYRSICDMSC